MKNFTPFLILLLFLFSCGGVKDGNETKEETQKPEPQYLYGICIDSLDVVEGKVKKNEFLANILKKEGVNYTTIDYIAKKHRDVFDVIMIISH